MIDKTVLGLSHQLGGQDVIFGGQRRHKYGCGRKVVDNQEVRCIVCLKE